VEIEQFRDKKIALLSGIGIPEAFEKTISELKLDFKYHFKFPDHFDYSILALKKMESRMTRMKIDTLITTEKDFVKLKKIDFIKFPMLVMEIEFYCSDSTLLKEL